VKKFDEIIATDPKVISQNTLSLGWCLKFFYCQITSGNPCLWHCV